MRKLALALGCAAMLAAPAAADAKTWRGRIMPALLQKASAQVKRSVIDVANIDAPPGGPIEALKSLAAEGVLISSGPMGAALRDVSAIQISA
jgi:hypothetical protein